MLAGWPVGDIDGLRARQAKLVLAGELTCPHHAGFRHRPMLPRHNAGLVSDIPRVNRTTIFNTRPHITKGFHLNDGLTSNPANHKGVLPKLSVTSLTKLKSQGFNALHFPKPLRKGFSTNSFDSRIPGKSLMSTAQYYELKKIYGEKPVARLDRILCRSKGRHNERRRREASCPLDHVCIGDVQIGKCLPARPNSPELLLGSDDLDRGAFPLCINTKSSESLEMDAEKAMLPTPETSIECPVNTPGSISPLKIHLAPLKLREVQPHSPATNTFKPKAETLADFMTSNIEHALWLHQRDLRMSPAILTDCPKILSRLGSNVHLPGLPNRPSPLAGSCHHLQSNSQGELYHNDTLTPAAARPTPVFTLEQSKLVPGPQRLRPKLINVGPDIPTDFQLGKNTPRSMSKIFGRRRHLRKARRSSNKNTQDAGKGENTACGKKKAELNIKGTQMKHKANSHLLNYLNYSRDYRLGHVIHPGMSCDRMESHWIANDLQTLSQQKLGKGLLAADWEFGVDEDGVSINTRLTSSPVDQPRNNNHIHLICGSNSTDDVWLRNISMIMACSSCSSSEMDSFSSGSASASSSVSLITSTTDLLMNLSKSQEKETATQNKDRELDGELKKPEKIKCAATEIKCATTTTAASDLTVTQTCSSANSDPARASTQTYALLPGVHQPPTTPASPSTIPHQLSQQTQSYPPSAFPSETSRTNWHSMSLNEGPLASIVLKYSTKGKVVPSLRIQDVKKRANMTQEKRGKVWRRKKRVPKVESKSVCHDADTEGVSSAGCLPEVITTDWKKPGLVCFTPIYDARYDQWKRRRVRHKDLSRKDNQKRNQVDKGSELEESEGCSDSDEGGPWQSAGASTTVDPHSSSSESDGTVTDVVSSVPLSPEPNDDNTSRATGLESQSMSVDKDSEGVTSSQESGSHYQQCASRKSDDKFPIREENFEAKSFRLTGRLSSVPEQETCTVDSKDEPDNAPADDQPAQSENLAKKLKAIFKRKPTSTIDLAESERGPARNSRISSAPGRTPIWLTESLAVSSIGPPPASELTALKTRQVGTSENAKKKVERAEKCIRSEKPPKKVTLQEILRFLPNIGLTSQEPPKECSHDLTRVLPSGRRADVTLCQSCICKMAMAQTASKTATGTLPTTAAGKNLPTVSQSTAAFKPSPLNQLPKSLPTVKLAVNPSLCINGTAEANPAELSKACAKNGTAEANTAELSKACAKNSTAEANTTELSKACAKNGIAEANTAELTKGCTNLSALPDIGHNRLPEIKSMGNPTRKAEGQDEPKTPANEITIVIPKIIDD